MDMFFGLEFYIKIFIDMFVPDISSYRTGSSTSFDSLDRLVPVSYRTRSDHSCKSDGNQDDCATKEDDDSLKLSSSCYHHERIEPYCADLTGTDAVVSGPTRGGLDDARSRMLSSMCLTDEMIDSPELGSPQAAAGLISGVQSSRVVKTTRPAKMSAGMSPNNGAGSGPLVLGLGESSLSLAEPTTLLDSSF